MARADRGRSRPAALAEAIGIIRIYETVVRIGAQACLIVARFDRQITAGGIERLHQEDACQALGREPKYQSRNRGGPSLREIARTRPQRCAPTEQLRKLLSVATFNLAIGNGDCHGKNIALLHDPVDTVRLAPIYDTVPTIMWSRLNRVGDGSRRTLLARRLRPQPPHRRGANLAAARGNGTRDRQQHP